MKKYYYATYLIITLILCLNTVNSSNCNLNPDQIILKCTIPSKYFLQDFTCLNIDCTSKLINKKEVLEIYENNIKKEIILQNNIPLTNINYEPNLIQQLCIETISNNTFKDINEILENYKNNKWNFLSDQKITIEPYSKEAIKSTIEKNQNSEKQLLNCYFFETEEKNGWIFSTKKIRPYCNLKFEQKENCFITSINYFKFAIYLLIHPSYLTFSYLIFILLTTFLSYTIIDTIIYLIKYKELKNFFSPEKEKIILLLILLIPNSFFAGKIINNILYDKFNLLLTPIIGTILFLISALITYFLSCFILYVYKKYLKKYFN